MKMFRRYVLIALTGLVLAACGGEDSARPSGDAKDLIDMTMGPETAPATLVEYASTTCGACAYYYENMHETIETLTEEGKLYFVFREFPRDQVDIAGFAVARCAGPENYFKVLGDLFKNQNGILAASRNGTVRNALEAIAARHGIDQAKFEGCLADEDIRTAISNAAVFGTNEGVRGTPTLFLNGVELDGVDGRSPESLIALVDAEQ